MTRLKFITAREVVHPILLILHVNEVPGSGKNSIHSNVDRKIISVTAVVTVHCSDDTFPSTDQKSSRAIDVICPSG